MKIRVLAVLSVVLLVLVAVAACGGGGSEGSSGGGSGGSSGGGSGSPDLSDTIVLPDGSTVPMWGYSCGAAVAGSTATCNASNPTATGWSPVAITVPTGQDLTINLTNNLSFANGNNVPTSLMIVGQLGGGLGGGGTTVASPTHDPLGVSWSTPNTPGGGNPTFIPPAQAPRVQSFGTEVASGATTALTWKAPRPGTYLLESGTHPSIQATMGLYGVLVVTSAPTSIFISTISCLLPFILPLSAANVN